MKFKQNLDLEKGLDITPLVDVVFQLLIFFMLTSNFIYQPSIKINLPKAVTSEVVHEKSLTLTINKEGLLYFNDKLISEKALKEELVQGAKSHKAIMLIKADRGTELGQVVKIWDLCRESGMTQINVATNRETP